MERLAAARKPRATLSPDEIRALLRECVTVAKPGEVLVLGVPDSWSPRQVNEAQCWVDEWLRGNAPEVKMLLMPAGRMAVAEPV